METGPSEEGDSPAADAKRRGTRDRYTRTADLGSPGANLDKGLQIAADLEDEELIRRLRAGA